MPVLTNALLGAELILGLLLFCSFTHDGPVLHGLLGLILFAHSALFIADD